MAGSSNIFFSGIVLNTDPVSYSVEVAPLESINSTGLLRGIPVIPFFSKFFGFKDATLPESGSKVFCYQIDSTSCLILGNVLQSDTDLRGASLRTVLKSGDGNFDDQNVQNPFAEHKQQWFNNNRPTDVVEGERVISNDFGVMLQLMQQFAALKASDLAQIQVHLLDDLVRIVSHNFQHYHSMGECNISHDGKTLNAEFEFTHQPEEALGSPMVTKGSKFVTPFSDQGTPVSTCNDEKDGYDFTTKSKEAMKAVARMKAYIGTLGDFFNVFISSPQKNNVYTLDGTPASNPDIGLAQFKATVDGGLYARSVKEIFLEKTNWIRVPQRIRLPEDPLGDDATKIELPDKVRFAYNNTTRYTTYNGLMLPYLYALQLRDYSAYMWEELGYANFKAFPKDFSIQTDQVDTTLHTVDSVDPHTTTRYIPATSGVYLMENGGIMLRDAWGSAIIMEGGHIYQQPALDLVQQPARHLIGKVGGVMNYEVNNDIDFVSATKGMRIKTEQSQYLYSRSGGVVLHSETANASAINPTDSALQTIGGVVFKSKTGIYNLSDSFNVISNHTALIKAPSLTLEAESALTLKSTKSGGFINVASQGDVAIGSSSGTFISSDTQTITYGKNSTIIGTSEQLIGSAQFGVGLVPVYGASPAADLTPIGDSFLSMAKNIDDQSNLPIFNNSDSVVGLKFYYLGSSEYGATDVIPMTISQQDDAVFDSYKYQTWQSGVSPIINGTTPYPGSTNYDKCLVTNEKLSNLHLERPDVVANATGLVNTATLSTVSLTNYKVFSS